MPGSAVQVTVLTASVRVRPLRSTGGFSGILVRVAVQPARGVVRTELIGVSVGRVTCSFTVPAVSDSVGTRSAMTA